MSKRILESIPVHSHDFTQFLIFHVSSLLAQFTAVRRNMIEYNKEDLRLNRNTVNENYDEIFV